MAFLLLHNYTDFITNVLDLYYTNKILSLKIELTNKQVEVI